MAIKKFTYRQPLTAAGIKAIEKGTLEWFDSEMFSNLNTGVLEQYLDEKNRVHSFARSIFSWKRVALGISIGVMFAVINQYIGLKIGLVTGGAWYITYLLGLALKFKPTEINMTSGAATGADRTCTGFVFTFPSIFLLAYSPFYAMSGGRIITSDLLGPYGTKILPLAMLCSMCASLMGIMYFQIFRRIWLVEDPLPAPGFQAAVKLMDIANDRASGAAEHAFRSIRLVLISLGIMGTFSFFRDFPVLDGKHPHTGELMPFRMSIMDHVFTNILGVGDLYYKGVIHPFARFPIISNYTNIGYNLTGIGMAIGWFMKIRSAFLVSLGALFTWLVVVPLIVFMKVPIYNAEFDVYYIPQNAYLFEMAAPYAANAGVAKIMAIGAILGGGMTALIKMTPTFATVFKDIWKTQKGGEKTQKKEWVPGAGWFEWPLQHLFVMPIVVSILVPLIFIFIGRFPILPSMIFGVVLASFTFILGAIAVKISGEVGTTPVSGTSFLCLILLWVIFGVINLLPTGEMGFTSLTFRSDAQFILMALVGTTVFGSSVSLSSDIIWDFKSGIYAGTRPANLIRGESTAIFFGTMAAATGAVFFSTWLADGTLDLEAPQAYAFATFAQMLMGGKVMMEVFVLGAAIGVFAELMTGMGTAFGLGMYLPLHYTLMLLTGGGARWGWEKFWLEPRAKRFGFSEREKTFKVLDTYMIGTGLLVSEALIGMFSAVFLAFFVPLMA